MGTQLKNGQETLNTREITSWVPSKAKENTPGAMGLPMTANGSTTCVLEPEFKTGLTEGSTSASGQKTTWTASASTLTQTTYATTGNSRQTKRTDTEFMCGPTVVSTKDGGPKENSMA